MADRWRRRRGGRVFQIVLWSRVRGDLTLNAATDPAGRPIESDPVVSRDRFHGRSAELKAVARVLRPSRRTPEAIRVVVLDGLGGAGKSTLMNEADARFRGSFEAVVRFDLKGSTAEPVAPGELLAELCGRLHVPAAEGGDEARYRRAIAGRRLLVLLDDAADAAQIRPLTGVSSDSVLLVTSRTELPGLRAATHVAVRSFPEREALGLLARALDPPDGADGAPTGAARVAAERQAATAIVRRCGCFPLAVHLVVATAFGRSRADVSLAELDADLAEHGLDLMASREDPGRSIRAIFTAGYGRLTPGLQRMFRLLASDLRDVRPADAAALAGVPEREAAEMLRDLHARHLVEQPADASYRLHDLLWEFANELRVPEEAAESAARLRALRLRELDAVLDADTLAGVGDVTRAASAEAARPEADDTWRFITRLAELYEMTEFPEDFPRLLEQAVASAEAAGPEAVAELRIAEARCHAHRGDWPEALAVLPESPRSLALRARAHLALGDPAEALRTARLSPVPAGLLVEAEALAALGDLAAAETLLRPLSAPRAGPARARPPVDVLAAPSDGHAVTADARPPVDRRTAPVDGRAREADSPPRSDGGPPGVGLAAAARPVERVRALIALAGVLRAGARADEARRTFEEAAARAEAIGDRRGRFVALVGLARSDGLSRGAALAVLRRAGDVYGRPWRAPTRDVVAVDAVLTAADLLLAHGQIGDAERMAGLVRGAETAGFTARWEEGVAARALAVGLPGYALDRLETVVAETPVAPRTASLLVRAHTGAEEYESAAAWAEYAVREGGPEHAPDRWTKAAWAGSVRARATVRRRLGPRWPDWVSLWLGLLICAVVTVSLTARDTPDVKASPLSGVTVLLACAFGALVAAKSRPERAGTLLGYLAPVLGATGTVLLTSDAVRARGDVGTLAGYGIAGAALLVALWRGPRGVPWPSASLVVLIPAYTEGPAPLLEPVGPGTWDAVGGVLLCLGAAFPFLAAVRHPSAYRLNLRLALALAAPVGGITAAMLWAGLGRQMNMLSPGHPGADWRYASAAAGVAAVCLAAGTIGPPALASGMLRGVAWFLGINAGLLGLVLPPADAPNAFLHPIANLQFWWGREPWPWLLPLLAMLLAVALYLCGDFSANPAHLQNPAFGGDSSDRSRRARRSRLRVAASRGLVLLAAAGVGAYLLDPAAEDALSGLVFAPIFFSLLAALVHPDVRVAALVPRRPRGSSGTASHLLQRLAAVRWHTFGGIAAVGYALFSAVRVALRLPADDWAVPAAETVAALGAAGVLLLWSRTGHRTLGHLSNAFAALFIGGVLGGLLLEGEVARAAFVVVVAIGAVVAERLYRRHRP
ncbi:NB-ARC domain-containing protein [Actinocorallia herbida]|uniref:NB-ARC domain-containing protein n=1 Tax=Actinocorallia herbida TaxID=58109 RepID=A0A3N1D0N2_9ACTN|nr:NB-ARC domain-containing protein [Actinocorallia herbida]ROO87087.1 NB-ARC domain-containing protein [Actinocorallia herbida]